MSDDERKLAFEKHFLNSSDHESAIRHELSHAFTAANGDAGDRAENSGQDTYAGAVQAELFPPLSAMQEWRMQKGDAPITEAGLKESLEAYAKASDSKKNTLIKKYPHEVQRMFHYVGNTEDPAEQRALIRTFSGLVEAVV